VLAVLAGCSATSAFAKSDAAFLTKAMKGDNSEIALGKLAVQKGDEKDVRSFGHTLVSDHRNAKRDAAAVAKQLGVPVTGKLTDEAKQERSKLQSLNGQAFDREFVSYMVSDHKKDISEFKDEAASGKGAVPQLAQKTLPTLRKHLHIAESLRTH
jgi:putative membrane protein